MKNFTYLLFLTIFIFSCSDVKPFSEELVGDWLYERETFNSLTNFEDLDTEGFISFNKDETGRWSQSNGFINYDLEWDLQSNDEKLSITKYLDGGQVIFPIITIFDINRSDEDNFTLTNHLNIESFLDSLNGFELFENIILTRMK